ncbi:hypothetical protein SLEP1_g38238 [Rubroshorea leprosula]|uniref:Uncharacterized protein n=1 Tax=Rubroshorea leprosula TaxID=152421 RepID=A0AAV5KX98_9ROSI|nr:hypothetical protein SLEP1_g38238 [Rubroshorea leprosula]
MPYSSKSEKFKISKRAIGVSRTLLKSLAVRLMEDWWIE